MNIRNTALTQKIESVRDAIERAESIDIGGSKPQLEQALASQLHLKGVIDDLVSVREETDRNIAAIRRVIELLDEPSSSRAGGDLYAKSALADKPVWQQAEEALRQAGKFMTVGGLVSKVRSIGGDPGKAASAAINNGLKRHDELFVIRKQRGRNYFGLREWGDGEDMQSMFEDEK